MNNKMPFKNHRLNYLTVSDIAFPTNDKRPFLGSSLDKWLQFFNVLREKVKSI
jgi:hypothetical protein